MKKGVALVFATFLMFGSMTKANRPDPLDILRGNIPDSFSSSSRSKNRKKKVEKKKRVKRVTSRYSISDYKRIKREYLGPTREINLKPIQYDLYSKHRLTGNSYLDMKAIDGPMPEDYATLYLKSKTLYNPVKPYLKIIIDKSSQRMYVYKDFHHIFTFKVSTGKAGHRTPSGVFKPYSLERMHYSRKYYNSPMPWSTFFNGGVAIHGTNSLGRLGHPASHGCVRTYPQSARRIYNLIRQYGKYNTTIVVRD
jgi:lipoprotein-anchoring transpeptidase ErfK/SrfK